jgi:predicted nucleic acid-binding protein
MDKAVFDTDIYIDWMNMGFHEDLVVRRSVLRFMSSVVLMELRAGARRTPDERLVQRLHDVASKTGRIVTPTTESFWHAGRVIRQLRRTFDYDVKKQMTIVNDALIALSCLQIGAILFTRNARDFQSIQRLLPLRLVIVNGFTV